MEKEEQLYIIFCEEHYNPLGLIRSLGETGIKPIAIVKKSKNLIASQSKYISKLHMVSTNDEGFELLKKEYGNLKVKPFLYTSDDQITSYLDKRYDELKDHFIFFNAGKAGRISEYMDKDNINKLAVKHGLKIAKSWVVKPGEIPKDIEYPIVTKAIISTIDSWKKDSFICNNEEELKDAFKSIRSEKILIQKFITKKNELCLDGFSVKKGQKVFYAIASNYNDMLANAYSNYMTVKNTYDHEIEKKLSKMFKEIGFEGIFSVEFLIDQDDSLYFLEINFRNSTWSYASTKAGMNLPVLWSRSMLDDSVVDKAYVKFDDFTAMAEFVDFKDRVKTKRISLWKWLKQMKECKCLYFINKHDMRPIYAKLINKLKGRTR